MRIVVFVCALATALPAMGAEKSPEAYIAFANSGGIQDWRALDDKGLYVRGTNRQWYYATLFASCFGLSTSHSVAFVTSPGGSLDKFSSIVVENSRCPVTSLVKSDPPPERARSAEKK